MDEDYFLNTIVAVTHTHHVNQQCLPIYRDDAMLDAASPSNLELRRWILLASIIS